MSEPLSLQQATADPRAFLERLRQATPAPLMIAGYPEPPLAGERAKVRRHVLAIEVDSIDSLGGSDLRLHLRDGTRLRTEGATLAALLGYLERAGYRFLKPHNHHALRIERAGGVGIDRDPIPLPAPQRARRSMAKEDNQIHPDLARLQVEIVGDEDGSTAIRFVEPLPTRSSIELQKATRYHLRLASSEATCPIGPGETQKRVIGRLAPFTCPSLTRLDRPEPDSRYAETVRNEGLVTVGGADFWALAMKKEKTQAERDAWIEQHKISNLTVAEAAALFSYKGTPAGASETKDWIERTKAMKNIVWQVHQWMQWGIIDAIKRLEEETTDPDPDPGDDDDDWDWDEPGDPDDPEEKKPNIRTLWYRYGKDALVNWGIHRDKKDEENFQRFIPYLARNQALFLYREFGFKDRMRKRRAIGTRRPHILVATEKDGMEGTATQFARQVGGSHLVLSGQPPKITMEYLTSDLLHELLKRGPLEAQEVHVFGLVDFNAAGYDILESIRSDIEHYVHRISGTRLKAVHSHNLVHIADMTDELIFTERKLQVQYQEKWVYVGGTRVKGKDFSDGAGNFSRLTTVKDWFDAHINDPRFHEVEKVGPGLVKETYYGLEIDDHPPGRLRRRFQDIVTKLKLLK